MKTVDVIVLGGGAAGLMCAIEAGRRGRRVLVVEGSNKVGKKILMSGGGRCNFTNLHCSAESFISSNPRFCVSALSRYSQWDFLDFVQRHQIAYHEKTLGQLFCDQSSKQILNALLTECEVAGVQILTHCDIASVENNAQFEVSTNKGKFSSESLVVATGGLSIPKMGASDFGYRLATQFGLKLQPRRAGLVPFTFTDATHELMQRLAGVSLEVGIEVNGMCFDESLLFTHRGISGPAVLQASSYWQAGRSVYIDLLPGGNFVEVLAEAKLLRPKTLIRSVLSDRLPRALVMELESLWWPIHAQCALQEVSRKDLNTLASNLQHWQLTPAGTEGYRTAEVTLGGVDTGELSSKTMECKSIPGLFFIGEVVDVTGHLGGFNFQWAWASGYAAGRNV